MRADRNKRNTKPLAFAGKLLIPLGILLLLILAFFGAKKIRTSRTTVMVEPVSALNWGYMEDSMSIDGIVYDHDSQIIYPDATQIISEVYVEPGQKVKTGDKLMAYDMDSQQLTLQIREVGLQKAKNDLAEAQKELVKLQNTKPVNPSPGSDDPIDDGEDDGSDVEIPTRPEKRKYKDAWNFLDKDSLEKYFLDPDVVITPDEATPEDAPELQDGSSGAEDDGDEDTASLIEDDLNKLGDGSLRNPYRYLVIEDGAVYGDFINAFIEKFKDTEDPVYASIEVREGNVESGNIISSVLINSKKIKEQKADDYWYVILRTPGDDPVAEEVEDLAEMVRKEQQGQQEQGQGESGGESGDDGGDISYTAAELQEAIKNQRRQIQELDLEVRRQELDLKILKEEMEDGVVTAKRDGVVSIVHDKDAPPQDGSPFLKVDAGNGAVVQGTISELLLDSIKPGQQITASDWETSGVYTGEITSIDDYPSEGAYYYGGNPNSSYYGFLAYFEDMTNMEPGHYLQLSLDANANKEDAIYLPNPYIRSDGNGKYVMKDVDGILTKEYIKCGKSYYGSVTEILEGLTDADYIAFPYGDGAVEGAHTEIGEAEEEVFF